MKSFHFVFFKPKSYLNKTVFKRNSESHLRRKPSTEPNKFDADTISNIVEEDDKRSYEDLEEISDKTFDELSRMEDAIL